MPYLTYYYYYYIRASTCFRTPEKQPSSARHLTHRSRHTHPHTHNNVYTQSVYYIVQTSHTLFTCIRICIVIIRVHRLSCRPSRSLLILRIHVLQQCSVKKGPAQELPTNEPPPPRDSRWDLFSIEINRVP